MDYPEEIVERASTIRLLIMDVDGVLTDGRLWFTAKGEELKAFHARDGHGIKLLQRIGVETAVISGRRSQAVALRMESLGIRHVYQGYEEKLQPFEELMAKLEVSPGATCYVGDDLLDLPIIRRVGLAVGVADAHFGIRPHLHHMTRMQGGMGAVREVCDLILYAQDQLEGIVKSYY